MMTIIREIIVNSIKDSKNSSNGNNKSNNYGISQK